MKKEVFNRTFISMLRETLLPILFSLTIMAAVVHGLNETERSSRAEGLRVLEEGVRRATMKCYAVEGSYPESMQYLEDHYGIYIDRTRYAVYYEIFASNMQPDITVIALRK